MRLRSDIKRCPACKRRKKRAIREQKAKKQPCNINGCVFKDEIETAIAKKDIPIIKRPKKIIQVVRREKPKIKINKK